MEGCEVVGDTSAKSRFRVSKSRAARSMEGLTACLRAKRALRNARAISVSPRFLSRNLLRMFDGRSKIAAITEQVSVNEERSASGMKYKTANEPSSRAVYKARSVSSADQSTE
ncbi:unnamed protein product [Lampetra fluviatilis]